MCGVMCVFRLFFVFAGTSSRPFTFARCCSFARLKIQLKTVIIEKKETTGKRRDVPRPTMSIPSLITMILTTCPADSLSKNQTEQFEGFWAAFSVLIRTLRGKYFSPCFPTLAVCNVRNNAAWSSSLSDTPHHHCVSAFLIPVYGGAGPDIWGPGVAHSCCLIMSCSAGR